MFKTAARTVEYLSINALEITLTGPFQISNPLDFSRTRNTDYRLKQEEVCKEMKKLFPRYHWKIPELRGGQKYESDSSGTGKAHSPPYYLECSIDSVQIKCSIEKYNFLIRKTKIKFYEFGFATVSVLCAISPKFDAKSSQYQMQASDVLRIVNKLDNKMVKGHIDQLNIIVSNVVKKFNNSIRENKIKEFVVNKKIADATADKKINYVRFLHRIFAYKVSKNTEIKVAQKTLNKIAKLSNGEWQSEKFCSHFVGVANSVIIHNYSIETSSDNINSEILRRYLSAYKTVLETANAYYFIVEYIRNGLFDYSRESVAIGGSKTTYKNREKFNKAETGLNEFIFLASNFFSMSDEFVTNLSPQAKNIWDRINKAWNTGNTTKMLQDQLQNSLQITDRVFSQTAQKSQNLANMIALASVAFGIISFIVLQSFDFNWEIYIDIWNFQNMDDLISEPINLIGLILSVVLVLGIFVILPLLVIVKNKRR